MSHQLRHGNEVHLFTLTRGGATKKRFELGLTIGEMGDVRYREMLDVERTIGFTGMRVIDLPDSGLKELDPREIEREVREEIMRVRPDIVVTYAVFGVSGFEDHLVTHAVVKRVFVEMRESAPWLRRLAMFTLDADNAAIRKSGFGLRGSKPNEIDCVMNIDQEDLDAFNRALDCYVTYQQTIDHSGVRTLIDREIHFEIFGETHQPPLGDLSEKL